MLIRDENRKRIRYEKLCFYVYCSKLKDNNMKKWINSFIAVTFLIISSRSLVSMEISRIYVSLEEKRTNLMSAARTADVVQVQKNLGQAKMRDIHGRTALMHQFLPSVMRTQPFYVGGPYGQLGIERSDKKVTILLLENGEDVNAVDKYGRNALMYLLRKLRDDVQEPTNLHNQDLQMALPIIKILVDNMSKEALNQVDIEGETAIYIAGCIRNGANTKIGRPTGFDFETNIVQLLLEKGADPYVVPTQTGQKHEEALVNAFCRVYITLSNEQSVHIFRELFSKKYPEFLEALHQRIR